MLRLLHIENIAVVEKSEIEFTDGLNVMTGETGAGKSIVIDAIGAVLGSRVPHDLIRTGAQSATVTAVFDGADVSRWFEDNGIEQGDGEIVLMRRLTADGKNTCRVNGFPVTVTQLRELGSRLMDIHGQNDGQKLLDEKNHLAYLDAFGDTAEEKHAYTEAFERYSEIKKQLNALEMDESEKARRIDALQYQIDEIEGAVISAGEADELTERRDFMRNAEKLADAVNTAFAAVYGGERGDGALSLIGAAESALDSAMRYSEKLAPIASAVSDLRYAAEDAAERLREVRSELEFSPNELDEIEGRLDLIKRLMRKYGGDETAVLEYLERSKNELAEIEYADEKLQRLEKELEIAEERAKADAEALSIKRKAAACVLEKRIMDELGELSMPGVKFEAAFDGKTELTRDGLDSVSFLMSANAGEAVGRISKIASGGELARIMLSMKNVLTEGDDTGSMIFDEIDTGVSGIAAQRVAEKLAALASKRQVICVTHLPQIAVMADAHFAITKSQTDGRTFTSVDMLDSVGRTREIARLTGGENITETTLSAAKEQLEAAKKYKDRL
ncbi:MAG: DNA repair protein RecN [Oscillospiraceae bacterium]|nr:DNA repair protein RecN [Oscillospiraceae bacterium]